MLRELVHCSSFLSWFLFFFSSLNHFSSIKNSYCSSSSRWRYF